MSCIELVVSSTGNSHADMQAQLRMALSPHACLGGHRTEVEDYKLFQDDDEDVDMGTEVERRQEMTAEKVHEIFKRISDEDAMALGFNPKFARPDWLIMTVFPVPPPPVRPSVMMDSSARHVLNHLF
jgi:DNA-directed RNA polymerase beta' subunit